MKKSNSKNNRDFNPYDLNQVGRERKSLQPRVIRRLSQTDDPYSTSSSICRRKRK